MREQIALRRRQEQEEMQQMQCHRQSDRFSRESSESGASVKGSKSDSTLAEKERGNNFRKETSKNCK